jgi:hypothetical protein
VGDEQGNAGETLAMVFGTALTLAAGVLLLIASVVFALYGVCLDYCDDAPDWTFFGALGHAAPFLLPALGLLIGGCCLFMIASAGRASVWRAVVLAVVSTLAFAGLFAVFGESFRVSEGFALIIGIVLAIGWLIGTSAVAYRSGLRQARY